MTKILITGGAGFIGGNFIHFMMKKYPAYKIHNLDLLTYAGDLTKHHQLYSYPNYSFTQLDIADRKAINELFYKEQFDFVVHFAAESHVDRSILDPGIFVHTNVLGTQVLLDAAKAIGVRKFVHISTDEVYGDLPFRPELYFTEETPLQPNSPYSASKASSDLLVRAYYETYGLPINITRCSNNYGPYHFPEKLIPMAITRVMKGQKVPVYGTGQNIRDWLHVYDHCAAVDLVLHNGADGEVYNIGGHNEHANLEVVKTIIKTLGRDYDLIQFVEDRLGHDKRYAIDPSKIEALGWKPVHSFESGIAETIQWYQENQRWWQQILSGEYRQYFEKQYSIE
ncbi:dTDP-glucose 4,6-dehydratase [Planococcus shenhongbingii]|uniref:dTDP-glucose 4,6-dehydratase n=1 Tax=Planococcus shenhongbingii TaxID=3058398 RepID=A0ABT8N9M5_9BACL|nr:dTDP-glucose 4,6-dehydratase [Planococcus sp. N017]MDN7244589.1 dTDP-glucose 4,6-dehydratase [Planococcus sp. N017]